MSLQQEAEIRALRKQCSALNEQIGIFLRQIKEQNELIASLRKQLTGHK
jgi:Tfp pilus assembly protein PilO